MLLQALCSPLQQGAEPLITKAAIASGQSSA